MRFDIVIWCENGTIYKAIYYYSVEKYVVRDMDTDMIVILKTGVSETEWKIFKLGIIKWKKPVQDAE